MARGILMKRLANARFASALAMCLISTSPTRAQFGTFRDDFGDDANPHAAQHNYEPGTVPAGGIWTGVHNSMNGGGPIGVPPTFVHADFVADGFNFFGTNKAGKLLIEDLVLHPNTDGQFGVGWETGINNAPFLYREVPAVANFTATMKIDAQNSGQWHYAPIIARLKAPTGAPNTPVGFGRGDTLDPTESFGTIGSFRTAADNNVASILTQSIVNAVETEVNTGGAVGNGLPLWVRMVKIGALFEAYSSRNGVDFTFRNSIVNAELNTPGEILQVGPSNMSFSSGSGATQSTVEIDFFELAIIIEEPPLPLPGDFNADGTVDARLRYVAQNQRLASRVQHLANGLRRNARQRQRQSGFRPRTDANRTCTDHSICALHKAATGGRGPFVAPPTVHPLRSKYRSTDPAAATLRPISVHIRSGLGVMPTRPQVQSIGVPTSGDRHIIVLSAAHMPHARVTQ
jgi:hypothetical protein